QQENGSPQSSRQLRRRLHRQVHQAGFRHGQLCRFALWQEPAAGSGPADAWWSELWPEPAMEPEPAAPVSAATRSELPHQARSSLQGPAERLPI
ncbi:hypothetical protein BGZ70_007611, partial [Mortierella alpina]